MAAENKKEPREWNLGNVHKAAKLPTVRPALKPLLRELGITQLELAERSGVPQSSISRFDKGSRYEITHLYAIAIALKVSIEDLFEYVDE